MPFNTGVGPDTRKASAPPPPFGKKPAVGVAVIMGKDKPPMGGMDHESEETPEQEGNEEYGARLVSDIDSVFSEYGADQKTGREIAAKLFSAVAKCLSGAGEESMEGEQQ